VEYSSRYASAADLTQLASLALNASLPAGFQAVFDESIGVAPVTDPLLNADGNTRWTIRAERTIVQQLNPARVAQLIQGIGATRAQTLLARNLPLDEPPEIRLSPSWWPWIPMAPFRISVVTD
jgi:hypothetical protein